MIELKNVSKVFPTAEGEFHALKDVSLTIGDGDIYGIVGMSGAGKSTLVRCINLLERPTAMVPFSRSRTASWNTSPTSPASL